MFKVTLLLLSSLVALNYGGKIQRLVPSGIVGGHEVTPNSVPFQISLRVNFYSKATHICGGAILDESHILTAAHCCERFDASYLSIVAGEHSLSQTSGDEQSSRVKSVYMHKQFEVLSLTHDICIVTLETKFEFNDKVQPVALPTQGQEFRGNVTVTGWGKLMDGGALPDVLMSADLQLFSYEKCQNMYEYETLDETMICARKVGSDTCDGDSGGPMTCNGDAKIHCGITSWGYGCADPKYPGVFVKTSYFINWINDAIASSN